MFKSTKARAIILVPLAVLAVMAIFFSLGYLITIIFRTSFSFAFPFPVRLLGLLLIALGFIFLSWLFTYRKPIDILVSTYVS